MDTTISYIQPSELERLISDEAERSKIVIIDVRDDDFIGGHIKGAVNAPTHNFDNDQYIDKLIKNVSSAKTIVFHCYKSQQRGPFCAKQFTRRLNELNNNASDTPSLNM